MKTLQQTEIYNSWGDPFHPDDVKKMQEDIRKMFNYDEDINFIIEESDDGFSIKFIKAKEE